MGRIPPKPRHSDRSTRLEVEPLREADSITHGRGILVFTYGSNIDGDVGAGYVRGSRKGDESSHDCSVGPQTVNRAEMTAQLAALGDIPEEVHIIIYTDSKCSIQYIQKWMVNPGFFTHHKHEDILLIICAKLASSTGDTHIYTKYQHM